MQAIYKKGEHVIVIGLCGEYLQLGTGVVCNVRWDSNDDPIFTVRLDDKDLTPDGLFVARANELHTLCAS